MHNSRTSTSTEYDEGYIGSYPAATRVCTCCSPFTHPPTTYVLLRDAKLVRCVDEDTTCRCLVAPFSLLLTYSVRPLASPIDMRGTGWSRAGKHHTRGRAEADGIVPWLGRCGTVQFAVRDAAALCSKRDYNCRCRAGKQHHAQEVGRCVVYTVAPLDTVAWGGAATVVRTLPLERWRCCAIRSSKQEACKADCGCHPCSFPGEHLSHFGLYAHSHPLFKASR